ncbi:MAG: hydantoinase/oxoprolinase family protein [Hydrocarboniphaga sp.]|uniref:hydantoinase/oxoprolinase family protein n=1 Tax=Hydrocarboniphaga sp. TaxID=2033016 RepID=UPI0026299C92|nr:hydantoinase/oxoprolinase family protein [Hydrocarboniphaga sp.]MDB5971293.1 hydantoinase/oxoprolinase family protein [Hydrocarboniphaga sp.]
MSPATAAAMAQPTAVPHAAGAGGMLINIDNGGTLTDICVIAGAQVYRTKTLTTPYDLSKCLFEGLRKVSRLIYGEDDLLKLLRNTAHIRYSTTQGTNALVERKGPRLGLITGGTLDARTMRSQAGAADLFDALIGDRVASLNVGGDEAALQKAAVAAVNQLASAGANRIIVAFGGADRGSAERHVRSVLLRKFPPHLLGAIPLLYSHEVVEDDNDPRRAWTAIFNAFLHPAMERFLYAAEHKLRENKARNPLLIFRNDGHSGRVAKTTAVMTYSSGPRGGMEGARALAAHYGYLQLLSMDVGGTTTDIGVVDKGVVRSETHGKVEGVATSLPLSDVISVGVGGSSIIKAERETISVGPQSVGSAPGPACFGLGGRLATITDAFLVQGLLDPASFFGGELKIDLERAKAAIAENVASPLGISVEAAATRMEDAWVRKVADALKAYTRISADTTLAAFGGGGPFVVCRVAEAAGVSRVLIPGLAAVFSAFGLGFSDIAHRFEAVLASRDAAGLKAATDEVMQKARRGMYGENIELDECRIETMLHIASKGETTTAALSDGKLPSDLPSDARLSVSLLVAKPIAQPQLSGKFGGASKAAKASGTRRILSAGQWLDVPLYRAEEQRGGSGAAGPAVLEEAFYTCRIEAGWRFDFNDSGDILLSTP